MGLATEVETGRWIVSPRAEPALAGAWRARRHHQDHAPGVGARRAGGGPPSRALCPAPREGDRARSSAGCSTRGLGGDEMGERVRLVIDGVDGRVHHLEMDAARAEEVGRGMIVAAGAAPTGPRAADRNILDIAGKEASIARPSIWSRRGTIDRLGGDPEALRPLPCPPAGGVAPRRPCRADRRRPLARPGRSSRARSSLRSARDRANIRISVLSPTGLDQQIGHDGATWLDRELASRQRTALADAGFGREVAAAMDRRRQASRHGTCRLGDGRPRAPRPDPAA